MSAANGSRSVGPVLTVLTPTEVRIAKCLFERMFPADERGPGAVEIGVVDYVGHALNGHDRKLAGAYKRILAAVDGAARASHGCSFTELVLSEQDLIVQALAEGHLRCALEEEDQRAIFRQLLAHLQEGLFGDPAYGGNRNAAGWRLLGHPGICLENSVDQDLPSGAAAPAGPVMALADIVGRLPHDDGEEDLKRDAYRNGVSPRFTDEVDVVVVGVGAVGGLVAQVFADAGLTVVGLEAGPWRSLDELLPDEIGQSNYGRGLGPKFDLEVPRWRKDALTDETTEATFSLGRMVNGVGGSLIHYGAWLRRYHPWHFSPLTWFTERYGQQIIPDGCTLVDWPVSYAELEPYYTRLEHIIGVAGDESNPYVQRSRPLPMPPTRPFPLGERFRKATADMGWHPHPAPVGMNTIPYDGRPATRYSAWGTGLGTNFGERWHPGLGPVRHAIASGRFELRTHCRVTRIITDSSGAARGVEYRDPNSRQRTQHARAVVIASYTFENVRLLFLSADRRHPDGLGNNTNQLGKHYMTKMFMRSYGYFPETHFNRHTGPATHAVLLDDLHADSFDCASHGFLGGATLSVEQQSLPLQASRECLPPGVQPWGKPYRDQVLRWQNLGMLDITPDALPYADHFIDIDPRHKDASDLGLPVVRLTYQLRENETRLASWMQGQASEILRRMGAAQTWAGPHFTGVGSSHDLGGCRYGTDPSSSVLDPWLLVHDTPNLHVYGGAAMPTCPGINPTLTILAMALRAAEKLAHDLSPREHAGTTAHQSEGGRG